MEEESDLMVYKGYDGACVNECKYAVGPHTTEDQSTVKRRKMVLHGGSLFPGDVRTSHIRLRT